MAQSIQQVMSADPVTLAMSASVHEAAKAMRDLDIGDVVVLDDSGSVSGIVTDRDIAIRAVAERADISDMTVGEICSRDLQMLSPSDSVGDAVRLMTEKAIRRLPIVEDGRPVGIVSLGDLAATQDPESGLADISSAPANN